MPPCTVCTGINLILAAPNCPVLDAWGILYIQTARVLLGACVRPRIRRRALRAPFLDPRTFPNVALRAVRLPLVELAIIVITRENPFAEPDLPSRRFPPAILHGGIYQSRAALSANPTMAVATDFLVLLPLNNCSSASRCDGGS